MIALLNAIATKFNGTASLTTDFPGGLTQNVAPEGTQFPYVVVQVTNATTATAFGQAHRDEITVRFVAYGVGHDATGTALETLDGVFNDTPLSLGTGQNYDCRRLTPPLPTMQTDFNEAGQEVWQWAVTYLYSVRN